MKRKTSAITALCLFAAAIVAVMSSPEKASAVISWPMDLPSIRIQTIYANSDDSLSMSGCNTFHTGSDGGYFIRESGVVQNTLPALSGNPLYCDQYSNMGEVATDGTFYLSRRNSTTSTDLVAWRQNKELWSVPITSADDCDPSSSIDKQMKPVSFSIGADGYIYMLLVPLSINPQSCPDRLVRVHRATGELEHILDLSNGPPGGSTFEPRVWTYSSKIVVFDRDGMIREFNYDGDEDVYAQYTFTRPSGQYIYTAIANSDGTVFVGTAGSGYSTLMYHKDDGDDGSISMSVVGDQPRLILADDGNVKALYYSFKFDSFNLSTETMTSTTLTNPHSGTYPNGRIDGMAVDEDGNLLVVRTFFTSSYTYSLVSVDLIEPGSPPTTTNLFELEKDTGDPGSPNPFVMSWGIDKSISNGYLYLSLCHEQSYGDCNNTIPPDYSWIYQIDTGDFGEPLQIRGGYDDYESSALNYVALGDSYSSGEGIPLYTSTTDIPNTNECHRSFDSYPSLLASEVIGSNTRLNLRSFVACSGALTSNVLSGGSGIGGWNEGAQIDAVSSETDLVTITIGGNDAGFGDYLEDCIMPSSGCNALSYAYALMEDRIDDLASSGDLEDTYRAILDAAPDAEVYVIDYPYITDPEGDVCGELDVTTAHQVQYQLNNVIDEAVGYVRAESSDYSSRLHYVATNFSGSPFEGKYLCNGATAAFGSTTFHPNILGQTYYKEVIADAIS